MKKRIKRFSVFLIFVLFREFSKPYEHYYSTAPDFVLNEIKREPNYLSAVIRAIVIWVACELLFWGIRKIKQKKQK